MTLVRPADLASVIPSINVMADQIEKWARGDLPIVVNPKVLGSWIQNSGITLGKLATSYTDAPPGYAVASGSFSAPVDCTATTDATANTIVTASAFTADGARAVLVSFSAPAISSTAVATVGARLALYDGSTSLGLLRAQEIPTQAIANPLGAMAVVITPSAASHTLSVRGWFAGTGTKITVQAGSGGAGSYLPGAILVQVI